MNNITLVLYMKSCLYKSLCSPFNLYKLFRVANLLQINNKYHYDLLKKKRLQFNTLYALFFYYVCGMVLGRVADPDLEPYFEKVRSWFLPLSESVFFILEGQLHPDQQPWLWVQVVVGSTTLVLGLGCGGIRNPGCGSRLWWDPEPWLCVQVVLGSATLDVGLGCVGIRNPGCGSKLCWDPQPWLWWDH